MAITYSDDKKQEWEEFKKHGGSITFEIDATDISSTRDFESLESLKRKLDTGFELPPTDLITSPGLQALIQAHGSQWDYILCRIYLRRGKVVYKRQANGKYEASCTVSIA